MNGMRKFLGFVVTALALGVLSLPANAAPAKIFGLVITPSNSPSNSVSATATFSNLTPNGNSVINTVILTPPAGSTNVVPSFPEGGNRVTCPATTVNSAGQTVPVPAGSICVANIPSVMKAGCSPIACHWAINVSATLPTSCGVNTWAGQAFAGNSFNGDVFSFTAANSSVTTTTSYQCPHNITASMSGPAGSGSITPAGVTQVAWDGSQTYTITAASSSFYIVDVKVDGVSVGPVTSYPFTMVEADHTIAATFAAKALSIVSKPSSAVVGTTFQVSVGITPAGGSVTADTSACGNATATLDASSTTSLAIFNVTIPSTYTGNTCTIVFNATNYTSIPLSGLPVYKGTIFCGDYDSVNGPSDLSYDPNGFTVPASTTDTLVDPGYVGTPGWGLRRGPNKDGAACVKVNYTCNMDTTQDPAVVTCTWDKNVVPAQQATFKYLFLWPAKAPDASGYSSYRPQVSWPPAVPDTTTTKAYKFPTWAPLVACISDTFPALPTLPTTILPQIPSAAPFTTDADNTLPQYQPTQTAWVCGGQSGWTAVGAPSGPALIQQWNIIIDEADLLVRGP